MTERSLTSLVVIQGSGTGASVWSLICWHLIEVIFFQLRLKKRKEGSCVQSNLVDEDGVRFPSKQMCVTLYLGRIFMNCLLDV